MLALIFLVILVIAGIVMLAIGKFTVQNSYGGGSRQYSLRPWSLIPLGFALIIVLLTSFYTQDPGEAIVQRSFTGSVVGIDTSSGIGFKAPWDENISFDIRNQRIEMYSNEGGEGKDGAVITAPLQGSSNAYISITIRYSIKPDAVQSIYEQYRSQDNLLDTALKPGVRDVVREATPQYPPFQVKERRAELSAMIYERLSADWERYGVIVDQVDLGELALDEKTEEALRTVNERQAQVEAARADLERAYIQAETTKTDAQAQADADQIIRCGATTTTETREIAGKPEQVTVITPKEGGACEERLNTQVLTSKYLDALKEIGNDGNMIFVIPNDPDGLMLQLPRP